MMSESQRLPAIPAVVLLFTIVPSARNQVMRIYRVPSTDSEVFVHAVRLQLKQQPVSEFAGEMTCQPHVKRPGQVFWRLVLVFEK